MNLNQPPVALGYLHDESKHYTPRVGDSLMVAVAVCTAAIALAAWVLVAILGG